MAYSQLRFHVFGHFLHRRIPPVENGPFRLDFFFPTRFFLSFLSSVESMFYFPRDGWCEGVLLYGSRKSVDSAVLRAFLASNACFTRDEASSKQVGGVGLSRKPPRLRSWRCAQPIAAKATAGVAVVAK